ncbi:MAG TPA: hypothetical protein VFP72_18825 [Kineosporiaceae bacterium]|nr:hypothetical protein [Kineosporiaceae bacterium]
MPPLSARGGPCLRNDPKHGYGAAGFIGAALERLGEPAARVAVADRDRSMVAGMVAVAARLADDNPPPDEPLPTRATSWPRIPLRRGGLGATPRLRTPAARVVFLGSEGETGVVARDFVDYLWLVADGYGPMEAIEYAPTDDEPRRDEPEAQALAEKLAGTARKSPAAVLARAQGEFPGFSSWIESMCR